MKLSQTTSEFLDRPYSEITCIDFIRQFRLKLGLSFPTNEEIEAVEFNKDKFNADNHLLAYQQEPFKMQELMVDLFGYFFELIEKNPKIGDVIILKNDSDIWPCVYIGNELAMTSFSDVGVKVFRYNLTSETYMIFRRD